MATLRENRLRCRYSVRRLVEERTREAIRTSLNVLQQLVRLLRSKRQRLHGQIADALEEGFPETVETQPELIAHHLSQAGLTERAIDYLRKAGQRTIERSANAEAIGHLTRALELLLTRPESRERTRTALALEVMLSQAMIAGRGYAAPETVEILEQAKAHIDDLTDPSQKLAILYGIWACHYVGGKVTKQSDVAAEFLAEAEQHNDTASRCVAHRIIGTTYVTKGEFAAALPHLERARALHDSGQHARLQYQYGQDIGAAALCYLSWALWHLGHIDQASEVAADAVKRAEDLSHPHTLVYVICHARGMIDILRRRSEDMQSYAGAVVSLCNQHGFLHWIGCGRILEGWAATCRGEIDQGIEVLRAGVTDWQKGGARLWLPMFLALEAEAYAKGGRSDAALQAIEQAMATAEETVRTGASPRCCASKPVCCWQAAARAIKSKLCSSRVSRLPEVNRRVAGNYVRPAILPSSGKPKGRGKEALHLLQPIYDQFTEGFNSADSRHAKQIIDSLNPNRGRKQAQVDKRGREPCGFRRSRPDVPK